MTKTLGEALLAAQAAAPSLQKDKINPGFKNKFVSLDQILHSVLPVLNENGLVLTQMPTVHELGAPALRTTLTHAATGDSVSDVMLLMLTKNDPQGQGSAITYARRYALMSLLGLTADADDDGVAASTRTASGRAAAGAGGAARKEAAAQTPPAPAPTNDYATPDQRRLIFDLATANGVSGPDLKKLVKKITGQESTAQMPADKVDAVIAAFATAETVA